MVDISEEAEQLLFNGPEREGGVMAMADTLRSVIQCYIYCNERVSRVSDGAFRDVCKCESSAEGRALYLQREILKVHFKRLREAMRDMQTRREKHMYLGESYSWDSFCSDRQAMHRLLICVRVGMKDFEKLCEVFEEACQREETNKTQ